MIKSKYKIAEDRISIRKMIMTSGRNINTNGEAKIYIEIITYVIGKKPQTRRIPTDVWVNPKYFTSKIDSGYITTKDPDHDNKNNAINKIFFQYGKIYGRMDSLKEIVVS